MFSVSGRSINDTWYFVDGDVVHMYFLTRIEGGTDGLDIGHAVTQDLVNWKDLGLALTRGAAGSWDDKNLATGSVIHRDGKYWMAYTGHKMGESLFIKRVGMARSDDLVRWGKMPQNPTSEADPLYYELVSTGD